MERKASAGQYFLPNFFFLRGE